LNDRGQIEPDDPALVETNLRDGGLENGERLPA
jgi:hypothetical protein